MKRIALIVVAAFFLIGCAGVQVSQQNVDPAYKIGKLAGAYVAITEPEYVAAALPYAQGLLAVAKSGEITDAQFFKATNLLYDKFGADKKYQVIAAMVLSDLGSIKIETGKVNDNVVQLISGFVDGAKAVQ